MQYFAFPVLRGVSGGPWGDVVATLPFQRQGISLALLVTVILHFLLVETRQAEGTIVPFATPGGAGHLARGRDEGAFHVIVDAGIGGF